jgi:hypothetical protein
MQCAVMNFPVSMVSKTFLRDYPDHASKGVSLQNVAFVLITKLVQCVKTMMMTVKMMVVVVQASQPPKH